MLFIIDCRDKPGLEEVRLANRQTHLDYLAGFLDKLVVAGPTLSDDGTHMTGSLLILDFADRGEAEAFAGADPYRRAGLFEAVSIRRWNKALPREG